MQSNVWSYPTIALIVAPVLFVAAVMGVIIWSSLHERRQRRDRHDELLSFGFTPLPAAPTELLRRVGSLRNGDPLRDGDTPQEVVLRRVYHQPMAGADMYLYEMQSSDSGSSTGRLSSDLAVIAPALRLPRLTLVPHFSLHGAMGDILGGLAKNAVNSAHLRMGLLPVKIDDPPSFTLHYAVMGHDAGAVRAFLTPARLLDLLALDRKYAIEGEADIFVISTAMAELMTVRGSEGHGLIDAYTLRQDAEELLALFGERKYASGG